MTEQTLSVLLLCWNHERYIEQCLQSLADQTASDFEIILLDNVSSDRSIELADRFLSGSGIAYRILKNERPLGIAANLNTLLSHATGDLVSVLSTDDWYAVLYVEAMIEASTDHPQVSWFSSGGWIFHEPSDDYEPIEKASFDGLDVSTSLVMGRQPFFFAGHCYRRAQLLAVGGWDAGQLIEDADLFFRLSKETEHWIVDNKLVYYRKHDASVSLNPAFMERGMERFFAKHGAAFPDSARNNRSICYREYAARYADLGKGRHATRAACRAIRLRPFVALNWRTLLYGLRVVVRHRAT